MTFQIGEVVRIRNYGIKRGKIVELWGALGPGGKQAYRVLVSRKPRRVYIDLTEDHIAPLPTKGKNGKAAGGGDPA